MISCNLQGGLGNQMFQIAAAYALALRNNTTSCFDLSGCYTPLQGNTSIKYINNFFSKLNNFKNDNCNKIYNETKFSFEKIPDEKELILNGYFQSEKYFKDFKNEIINLFNIPESEEIKKYLLEFHNKNKPITVVHVRRGDYLNNLLFHSVCSAEYYMKAMNKIGESNFIFVSDDMEWVKENFKGENIWYSNFTDEINDFLLMVYSDNIVISNSSFSWWGAYLNKNPNKTIIAPKNWFGPKGPKDIKDIIPNNWLIL